MIYNYDNFHELTKDEVSSLLGSCAIAESNRAQLQDEVNHNLGIQQAIKIMRKYNFISYNGVKIDSGYDRRSQNHFTCINTPSSFGGMYDYTGTIESRAISHIWAIMECFKES